MQLGTTVDSGQVAHAGLQVQTLCRQQQRQQEHHADSHGGLKLLSGDSSVDGAEFGFRPVSPL